MGEKRRKMNEVLPLATPSINLCGTHLNTSKNPNETIERELKRIKRIVET